MSVVLFLNGAMRGRPKRPDLRRRRVSFPFGVPRAVRPGTWLTVFNVIDVSGQPTGELLLEFRSHFGTVTIQRPIHGRPFDISQHAMLRMLAIEIDARDVNAARAIGLHAEVTEVFKDIPSIA